MAEALPDVFARMLNRLHQRKHLRNALNREGLQRITGGKQFPVYAVQGHAQMVSRHRRQRRNVIRDVALTQQRAHFIKNFIKERFHGYPIESSRKKAS